MRNTGGYYEKIVVTKGILEIFRYEKLNTKGGGKRERNGADKDKNYKQTQRKRRTKIRQLICANFDNLNCKFLTLTFNNSQGFDIKDVKACNEYFKKFIQRLKYRYQDLLYVAVIEFQDKNDRGAVHYHMICNLPYVKKSDLSEIWGAGFIKINRIDKVDNMGAYVIKYMNEDLDDIRLQGLKAYNCSKGLQRPQELKTWDEDHISRIRYYEGLVKEISPSYFAEYESENAGHIEYRQYNLGRTNSTSNAPASQERSKRNDTASK